MTMMARNGQRLAVLAVALVEALAISLIILVPDKMAFWLVAALAVPLLWLGAAVMKCDKDSIYYAVAGAALMVGLALAISTMRALGLLDQGDSSLALRLFGTFNGAVLVFYGNVVPKRLVRYDPGAADPGRKAALLRFSGWVFVLAGLAHIAIWLFAPIGRAALWSMVPVAGGLALVAIRIFRAGYWQRGKA